MFACIQASSESEDVHEASGESEDVQVASCESEDIQEVPSEYEDVQEAPSESDDVQEENNHRSVEERAGLFLLTLKELFKLTQAAINFAVTSVNGIVSEVCDSFKQFLQAVVREPDLDQIILEHNNLFSSMETEYQQSKFYRENFGLVVSMSFIC